MSDQVRGVLVPRALHNALRGVSPQPTSRTESRRPRPRLGSFDSPQPASPTELKRPRPRLGNCGREAVAAPMSPAMLEMTAPKSTAPARLQPLLDGRTCASGGTLSGARGDPGFEDKGVDAADDPGDKVT
mmetsp:Transcript_104030/g.293386  ORF Transcript_104030/g.293386 Transcript_104030/m.293386 type:complete len:130 (+) Transcript_104030:750-1139(+)